MNLSKKLLLSSLGSVFFLSGCFSSHTVTHDSRYSSTNTRAPSLTEINNILAEESTWNIKEKGKWYYNKENGVFEKYYHSDEERAIDSFDTYLFFDKEEPEGKKYDSKVFIERRRAELVLSEKKRRDFFAQTAPNYPELKALSRLKLDKPAINLRKPARLMIDHPSFSLEGKIKSFKTRTPSQIFDATRFNEKFPGVIEGGQFLKAWVNVNIFPQIEETDPGCPYLAVMNEGAGANQVNRVNLQYIHGSILQKDKINFIFSKEPIILNMSGYMVFGNKFLCGNKVVDVDSSESQPILCEDMSYRQKKSNNHQHKSASSVQVGAQKEWTLNLKPAENKNLTALSQAVTIDGQSEMYPVVPIGEVEKVLKEGPTEEELESFFAESTDAETQNLLSLDYVGTNRFSLYLSNSNNDKPGAKSAFKMCVGGIDVYVSAFYDDNNKMKNQKTFNTTAMSQTFAVGRSVQFCESKFSGLLGLGFAYRNGEAKSSHMIAGSPLITTLKQKGWGTHLKVGARFEASGWSVDTNLGVPLYNNVKTSRRFNEVDSCVVTKPSQKLLWSLQLNKNHALGQYSLGLTKLGLRIKSSFTF